MALSLENSLTLVTGVGYGECAQQTRQGCTLPSAHPCPDLDGSVAAGRDGVDDFDKARYLRVDFGKVITRELPPADAVGLASGRSALGILPKFKLNFSFSEGIALVSAFGGAHTPCNYMRRNCMSWNSWSLWSSWRKNLQKMKKAQMVPGLRG